MKSHWSLGVCVLLSLSGCAATAPGGHFGFGFSRQLPLPFEPRGEEIRVYELPKRSNELSPVFDQEGASQFKMQPKKSVPPSAPIELPQPEIRSDEKERVEPPRKKMAPMPNFRRGSRGASIASILRSFEGRVA